jgi:hypothetical protein
LKSQYNKQPYVCKGNVNGLFCTKRAFAAIYAAGVTYLSLCAGEKVKNISKHTAVGLIDFCVSASCARYSSESFGLNIKKFCEPTARSSELAGLILSVITLRTFISRVVHNLYSPILSIPIALLLNSQSSGTI